MNRRTLLRGLAAGTVAGGFASAGCLSVPRADGGTGTETDTDGLPTGTGTDDTRPADDDQPPDAVAQATIAATDPAPDLPVSPQVSFADPWVTSGSPPVLRVDVDNPTDAPVTVGEYRDVVFQYVTGADDTLVWLPHSERSTEGDPDRIRPEYETTGEGCFQLAEPYLLTEEYGTVEIPAGGTLTAYVGLYVPAEADPAAESTGCLPVGDHRFETTYATFPDGVDGGAQRRADWGFSLSLSALE